MAKTLPRHSRTMALALIAFDFFQSAFESVGVVVEEEPRAEFYRVDVSQMRILELKGYGLGRGVTGGGWVVVEGRCYGKGDAWG